LHVALWAKALPASKQSAAANATDFIEASLAAFRANILLFAHRPIRRIELRQYCFANALPKAPMLIAGLSGNAIALLS
jgi:hypothetical protein